MTKKEKKLLIPEMNPGSCAFVYHYPPLQVVAMLIGVLAMAIKRGHLYV